jgi:hypothetical protein
MNPLLVRLGRAAIRRGRSEAVSPEFLEEYPTLAAAMAGCEAADGEAGVPAMTLRYFWEAGTMKCCLGRHNHPTCLFLTVSDPVKALECTERVLASGGGEVRSTKQS